MVCVGLYSNKLFVNNFSVNALPGNNKNQFNNCGPPGDVVWVTGWPEFEICLSQNFFLLLFYIFFIDLIILNVYTSAQT